MVKILATLQVVSTAKRLIYVPHYYVLSENEVKENIVQHPCCLFEQHKKRLPERELTVGEDSG